MGLDFLTSSSESEDSVFTAFLVALGFAAPALSRYGLTTSDDSSDKSTFFLLTFLYGFLRIGTSSESELSFSAFGSGFVGFSSDSDESYCFCTRCYLLRTGTSSDDEDSRSCLGFDGAYLGCLLVCF